MDRRRFLLTSQFVALVVAAYLLAGCGGVSPSTAWQAHCAQGSYAPQSLDEWFRTSAEVIQGRQGPQVEGYIYNNYFAEAEQILVGLEQLSPSGQAVACATVWVTGSLPPRNRAYFVAPAPDAARTIGCVSFHSTGRRREGNNRCSVSPFNLAHRLAFGCDRLDLEAGARQMCQAGLKSRGVTWLTFALIRPTMPAWTAAASC